MIKAAHDGTIVAVSTPIGDGGIGIVRLSGPNSLKIADKLFVPASGKKPSSCRTYTAHYGKIVDRTYLTKAKKGKQGPGAGMSEVVDEVILTVMRKPKSYTREDIVEINCHGGIQAVKRVLELALKSGSRLAEPGEFTKRAFLNGRIDLAQAEAVSDVIRAKTDSSLKVAVSQLEGGLSEAVNSLREAAIGIASDIEASIDFPEEDIEVSDRKRLANSSRAIVSRLERLIKTYSEGVMLREGVLAIICGKPNVGKSSLMNLLLKRDRVIVSPTPGTTRDAVEEMINLKGIPIRLVDTAGIADTKELLEIESVARSKRYLALADIAIAMFDCSRRIDRTDEAVVDIIARKKKVVVLNKCDLVKKISAKNIKNMFREDKVVEISVETRKNIDALEDAIADTVLSGGFTQGESAIVSNARHKELLDRARDNMLSVVKALDKVLPPELIAIDLKEAICCLGLIIGKAVSDDILDRIFDRFCIGK